MKLGTPPRSNQHSHRVIASPRRIQKRQKFDTLLTLPGMARLVAAAALLYLADAQARGTVEAAFASLSRTLGRDATALFALRLDPASNCVSVDSDPTGLVAINASSAVDLVYAVRPGSYSIIQYLRHV